MNSMKLNVIAVGTVVVLTAGFGFGVVRPGLKEVQAQHEQLTTEALHVRDEQQCVGDIADLYASIVALNARMQDFRRRLPEGREFGEFLNQLAENLRKSSIDDYTVEPRQAVLVDEAKLPESLSNVRGTHLLPVRVEFEGRFENIVEFIHLLEALPRLSHVENVRMVNRESRPGHVGVEFVIHTYYRPEY